MMFPLVWILGGAASIGYGLHRLNQQDKFDRLSPEEKRRYIFQRENWTCQHCGQRYYSMNLEIDHKIPVSRGGKDTFDNLHTLCFWCNRAKGNKTWWEFHFLN